MRQLTRCAFSPCGSLLFAACESGAIVCYGTVKRERLGKREKIFTDRCNQAVAVLTIQGCWANSDDGNRQKSSELAQSCWFKSFDLKNEF